MATIYQHWVGTLTAKEAPIHSESNQIDEWFPSTSPPGATLIATDTYDSDTQVFHKVLSIKTKVGPINISVGEDIFFRGKLEYYQTK